MKAVLAAAALFAAMGFALAQPIDPDEIPEADAPPPPEAYGPPPIDEVDFRIIKHDAANVCGNRPDSMLDLIAWRIYRICMEEELDRSLGPPQ